MWCSAPRAVFKRDSRIIFGSASPVSSQWHHVALSANGLFIDGRLSAAAAGSWNPSTTNLTIGSFGAANLFAGAIDDVRVYSRVLSASKVGELYNNSRRGYPDLLNQTKTVSFFMRSTYNEVMSGGVFEGTSATIQTSYNSSITSAGVWASDTGIAEETDNIRLIRLMRVLFHGYQVSLI